jgi:hypothetical protein
MGDASTIDKLAVYDDRIIQAPPKYGIVRGANSVNSMPFDASTQSSSQHQYTIQVPNQGVFVDRSILWTSTVQLQATISFTVAGGSVIESFEPVLSPGDVSLASFPLHRLVNVLNASINNQQVTFNGDILEEVLHLIDTDSDRNRRLCPTALDTTKYYNDSIDQNTAPLAAGETTTANFVPNGAFPGFDFVTSSGDNAVVTVGGAEGTLIPITGAPAGCYIAWATTFSPGSPTIAVPGGYLMYYNSTGTALGAGTYSFPVYMRFTSTERLVLSPFIFAECHSRDTGLFGINNIQVTMSIASPNTTGHTGRVIRCSGSTLPSGLSAFGLSNLSFNQTNGVAPFKNSKMTCQFFDPNWSEPLPPRSIVPYMDYTRYISSAIGLTNGIAAYTTNGGPTVTSPTITLPYIPDLLIISVRPTQYANAETADWSYPISGIRLQWANRSGLLSQHTQEQLYDMSTANGLRMSWSQFYGACWGQGDGKVVPWDIRTPNRPVAVKYQTAGGFLVLRPGVDFPLDPSQAPGMVGNFLMQANLTLSNPAPLPVAAGDVQVQVIAVNSGFFATVFGTSMIVRGVVMPEDAVRTDIQAAASGEVDRYVGGSFWGKINSGIQKVVPWARRVAQAVKPHLSEQHQATIDKADEYAKSMGYGRSGGSSGAIGGYIGGAHVGGVKRRMLDRVDH